MMSASDYNYHIRPYLFSAYMLSTRCTVRAAAAVFGVSKSLIHRDITVRLRAMNPGLASQIEELMKSNKAEGQIRGGMATKLKYAKT